MFTKHSSIFKAIALILTISIVAGCAKKIYRGEEVIGKTGGLSPIEGVGIGVGAAIAAIVIGKVIYDAVNENEVDGQAEKDWITRGPTIPTQFTLSDMSVDGFVQGGWPIAVDFQLTHPGQVYLRVALDGIDPYKIAMDGSTANRKLQIFRLPSGLGSSPKFAKIQVFAVEPGSDAETPIPIKIFGIACGPNAVGSIGIDNINFGPDNIMLSQQQQAGYFFFSHKSFNKVSAAFRKVEDQNGIIGIRDIVKEETIDMPAIDESKGQWIGTRQMPRVWDGKTKDNKPSQGFHILQVRAWFGDAAKRDWGVALSPDWVEVKI